MIFQHMPDQSAVTPCASISANQIPLLKLEKSPLNNHVSQGGLHLIEIFAMLVLYLRILLSNIWRCLYGNLLSNRQAW
jgi:hypothetical protein